MINPVCRLAAAQEGSSARCQEFQRLNTHVSITIIVIYMFIINLRCAFKDQLIILKWECVV